MRKKRKTRKKTLIRKMNLSKHSKTIRRARKENSISMISEREVRERKKNFTHTFKYQSMNA